jgi:hypothetical protein
VKKALMRVNDLVDADPYLDNAKDPDATALRREAQATWKSLQALMRAALNYAENQAP